MPAEPPKLVLRLLNSMGLQPGATHDDVKMRYRQMPRNIHPDTKPNAPREAETRGGVQEV
ncbi:J domain-containing protein [Candidatus Micrarchaeota archaeon]|nr:J domain-containing protein [Candidatus Micrarchaeota archaeon]